MSSKKSAVKRNRSYSLFQTGKLNDWRNHIFENSRVPATQGKLFLKELLELTGMEVSLNVLLPGEMIPFYHKHRNNEELYIFIKGRGQFQIDGKIIDVREGSVIRVAPEAVRAYRNHSGENLYFMVVQARAGSFADAGISDGMGAGSPVEWP